MCIMYWVLFFKQKTAYELRISDWSSDVCSFDLVAAPEAGRAIVDAALKAFGRIDVLVNNAGVGGSKRLEDSDDALLARIVDINLGSLMRITRAVQIGRASCRERV